MICSIMKYDYQIRWNTNAAGHHRKQAQPEALDLGGIKNGILL